MICAFIKLSKLCINANTDIVTVNQKELKQQRQKHLNILYSNSVLLPDWWSIAFCRSLSLRCLCCTELNAHMLFTLRLVSSGDTLNIIML